MKAFRTTSLTIAVLCTISPASMAATVASNLSNPDVGSNMLYLGDSPMAQSFTTGPQPSVLDSMTVKVFGGSSTQFPVQFFGAVWSDAGGHPGVPLESFPELDFPQGERLVTFPSADLALQPDTTYWFLLSQHNGLLAYWHDTVLTTEDSAYGWTIGDNTWSRDPVNGTWIASQGSDGHQYDIGRLSVDATILPEPSIVLAASGLTFPLLTRRSPRRRTRRT